MQLNVEIKGQGQPILCLHGHPGSSRAMSVFTEHLSQRFQTIAPDLRGYGNSRCQGRFEMEAHLEDLEGLLERLGIECCPILGWSLGGILAMELAVRAPSRYSGLILIATAARPWSNHPQTNVTELLYTGIAGIVNWIVPGQQWNIDTFGRRSLFRYLFGRQIPRAYRYVATDAIPAFLQTSWAANNALERAIAKGYNRLDNLTLLQMPCLALAGEQDRHITAQSSRETAEQLPNCRWRCYSQVAHLFPWEIPKTVLKDIDDWLEAYPEVVARAEFSPQSKLKP